METSSIFLSEAWLLSWLTVLRQETKLHSIINLLKQRPVALQGLQISLRNHQPLFFLSRLGAKNIIKEVEGILLSGHSCQATLVAGNNKLVASSTINQSYSA